MSPCFCLPWPESIEVKQEYPYILSYNHYCKYIYLREIESIRMLLYDRGTKMGPQERWRIPHFPCSNDQDTLHLGDVLRRGLRDKLMSEHVLRRGGMRESEIPFEMMSRALLLGA